MGKMPPSIFNDVLGPVMRGPSSSHVAGAHRIADIIRQSLSSPPVRAAADFDINGSLAASHTGHGTDMGFVCGLLGKAITDADADRYEALAEAAGLSVDFRILDYGAKHPNYYRTEAKDAAGTTRRWDAVSVGGGMIEMVRYNGYPVSVCGDFYEVLAEFADAAAADAFCEAAGLLPVTPDYADTASGDSGALTCLKYHAEPDRTALSSLFGGKKDGLAFIAPVLPTHSSAGCAPLFSTASEMRALYEGTEKSLWEAASDYEARRGGTDAADVLLKMRGLTDIMQKALTDGLAGTSYGDRILGPQAHLIEEAEKKGALLPCSLMSTVIKSVTAIMETKSSMGVIVAAPTAGSCGCLPGAVIGAGLELGRSKDDIAKAMLAASAIGLFIAGNATFAAEVGGCQVECGAGSGMAAAGLTQLMGGTMAQCVDAASMALQNITGLACDPVANRVEVPCLGKNVMGASNALACANMALAGYDKVIPLDETIAAMYDTGLKLPLELRCTCGGLGKTPTSERILKELEQNKNSGGCCRSSR